MGIARFSGNGNYELDIDAAVARQNYAENYSDIYWRVIVRKLSGSGFWSAASGGNNGVADSPLGGYLDLWNASNFSYDFRSTGEILFAQGEFRLYHDGNGYADYWVNGGMNLVNLGNANAGSGTKSAPRIPKAPASPSTPRFSNIMPTTATVSWDPSPNHKGASVDFQILRLHTVSPADSSGYTDYGVGPGVTSVNLTGLRPGTTYYAVAYARNQMGYSPKSGQATMRTLSGAYAWDGGRWQPAEVMVWNGTAWQTGEVRTWSGTEWALAS